MVNDTKWQDMIERLAGRSQTLKIIVEDLLKRDPRFLFLKQATDEFLHGEFGVRETLTLVLLEPEDDQEHRKIYRRLVHVFIRITNSMIYEILNVFGFDMSLEQALVGGVEHDTRQKVRLLEDLNKKSKNLQPKPAEILPVTVPNPNSLKEHGYRYSSSLDCSHIRLLHVLPGSDESPLECRLDVYNLDGGNAIAAEALSYVWGKPIFDKIINVDGMTFSVTSHLHDILTSLRQCDTPRVLWIDAICINQSNKGEKVKQVRLMRDIYSRAQRTIIWLGDETTHQKISAFAEEIPASVYAKALEGRTNQFDLVAILEQCWKNKEINPQDNRTVAIAIALVHCVNHIMTDSWWERVWTIQEATLPALEPIIHFRGHSFPYSTVMSALDAVTTIEDRVSSSNFYAPTAHLSEYQQHMRTLLDSQLRLHQVDGAGGNEPLLRWLRPENRRIHRNLRRKDILEDRRLEELLELVSDYRATDPRDKIFALESLLLKSLGRLINVNYNEPTEAVFRRISACFLGSINDVCRYHLLLECQNEGENGISGPTWVHDFSYSNLKSRDYRKQTLHGYLLRHDQSQPMISRDGGKDMCFATPKTLFCTGFSVDVIRYVKVIPDLTQAEPEDLYHFLAEFIQEAHPDWAELSIAAQLRSRQTEDHAAEYPAGTEDRSDRSSDCESNSSGDEVSAECSPPDAKQIMDLVTLQSLYWIGLFQPDLSEQTRREYFASTVRGIAGTWLFATETGIVALATAPVQKGDIFSVIYKFHNYLILREAEGRKEEDHATAHGAGKYRIVARAGVAEDRDRMVRRIKKRRIPKRHFQII
ncbi:heterokaryon incompatibility protein-domain-containing protein [Xylariaceae sp. FL0255]|nr:heterokaryon incompatibility protein-domain-containing protein [Xylariaceae sp. FL0255]